MKRSAVLALTLTLVLSSSAHAQARRFLDRSILVMDAEFRQLYLLGPGERFQLVGLPHLDHSFTSLQTAPSGWLYSVSNVTDTLHRLDPRSGISSIVGEIGVDIGWGGLAISPDGRAWTPASTGSILVELNLNTGEAINLQGYGPMELRGLAWRSDGVLIGLDTRRVNSLLEITPMVSVRGLATVPVPVGANGGMAIDGGEGYFATGGIQVGGSHRLYRFNPFDGEIWFLTDLPPMFANQGTVGIALLPKHESARQACSPAPQGSPSF